MSPARNFSAPDEVEIEEATCCNGQRADLWYAQQSSRKLLCDPVSVWYPEQRYHIAE
jgi:hypothetical protein